VTAEILPKIVHSLLSTLEKISDAQWQEENLEAAIQNILASGTFKKGQLLWPLRSALTGRLYSPGAFEVAAVLGREKVLERLRRALNTIHA
jgi:glutamyl-tRNA synthetase